MSRLRRWLITHRIFFLTTHFAKAALPVSETDRDEVLRALSETRIFRQIVLFAYCVMPTHLHVMFVPSRNDSMSNVMRDVKIRAAKRIRRTRKTRGSLWQSRSFDRIIRNTREWGETLDYIHWNPVKDGLTKKPEEWRWSSWYGWNPGGCPPVPVDVVEMPIDQEAPIGW